MKLGTYYKRAIEAEKAAVKDKVAALRNYVKEGEELVKEQGKTTGDFSNHIDALYTAGTIGYANKSAKMMLKCAREKGLVEKLITEKKFQGNLLSLSLSSTYNWLVDQTDTKKPRVKTPKDKFWEDFEHTIALGKQYATLLFEVRDFYTEHNVEVDKAYMAQFMASADRVQKALAGITQTSTSLRIKYQPHLEVVN